HPAAQHGDHIGAENKTQRPFLQDGTHASNVNDEEATLQPDELAMRVRVFLCVLWEYLCELGGQKLLTAKGAKKLRKGRKGFLSRRLAVRRPMDLHPACFP